MLTTPFGCIRIFADSCEIPYEAIPYTDTRKSILERPLTGCYRITVETRKYKSIRCCLEWNREPLECIEGPGERYLAAEFIDGKCDLSIGMEDESTSFDSLCHDNGLEYVLREAVRYVVFGIAWADDYSGGDDARTWLAADPT